MLRVFGKKVSVGFSRPIGSVRWSFKATDGKYSRLRQLGYIPTEDRDEIVRLHFSDPETFTPEHLSIVTGCPIVNIRGLLRLATMQMKYEELFTRRYLWNIVPDEDENANPQRESEEPSSGSGYRFDAPVEFRDKTDDAPGAVNSNSATKWEEPRAYAMKALSVEDREILDQQKEDGVLYKKVQQTKLEMNILGKAKEYWDDMIEPKPDLSKEDIENTALEASIITANRPRYVTTNDLKLEVSERRVRRTLPDLYARIARLKTQSGMSTTAEKLLSMTLSDHRAATDSRFLPKDKQRPTYVFMDISEEIESNADRRIWKYDTNISYEGDEGRKEADVDERDRMLLSISVVPKRHAI